ncbi:hypothetical protein GOEFS_012_00110 [Gordonia effusa NBRC 100432]|uniref:Uncharacterized protein n=1 Tax=Gordonia effusa NBRC 100432 TaxID=1077974 RepID=H0QV59_9ACTN|nr:hypothetical protein [Gordonia effusa]GAB16710.1 hypothetical protein GOEFS_012_00110 [Gordonia effusa NBRC 100432]
MDIDEVADELYGLDPADFVTVRKERVAQAKADGDRELAREIGLLRKPTLVGWAVNVLARESVDDVAGLLEVGDALREAQHALSADQLRALDKQRQQVIRGLIKRTVSLAAGRGQVLSENASREVGQTLGAAMADPDFGEQLRRGRVITAVHHAGFGSGGEEVFGRAGLRVIEGGASKKKAKPDVDELRASLRKALADAQTTLDDAESDVEQAEEALDEVTQRRVECEEHIDELRSQLSEAESELQLAKRSEDAAKKQRTQADREKASARTTVERLQAQLDTL